MATEEAKAVDRPAVGADRSGSPTPSDGLTFPKAGGPATADRPGGPSIVTRQPGAQESDPRRYRNRRRRLEVGLGIAIPVLLFAGWQWASKTGALDPRFFPAPSDLWSTAVRLFQTGVMGHEIVTSFRRVFEGFFMGVAAALILGVAIGASHIARSALQPVIYGFWAIPKLAILPLLLLFFGLSEFPIILLIAIECFFLVLIPTIAAVSTVSESYREVATSFNAGRLQMLRYVLIPGAMPLIVVALRLAAGASVLVMVAGEYIDGKEGLGFFIFNSWQLFEPKQMYVGIIVVSILGTIWTLVVQAVGRYLTRWQRET
jgi:ABC-type nitrate/sulfonate/bicarbonate transport system permease component